MITRWKKKVLHIEVLQKQDNNNNIIIININNLNRQWSNKRLAQQRMWFTSIATLEAGSAVDVFDPAVEASTRDLGENLKRPMQRDVEMDKVRRRMGLNVWISSFLFGLQTVSSWVCPWFYFFFFQTPTFNCNLRHRQGAFHCIYGCSRTIFTSHNNSEARIGGKAQVRVKSFQTPTFSLCHALVWKLIYIYTSLIVQTRSWCTIIDYRWDIGSSHCFDSVCGPCDHWFKVRLVEILKTHRLSVSTQRQPVAASLKIM